MQRLLVSAAFVLVGLAGCQHHCCLRQRHGAPPGSYQVPPPPPRFPTVGAPALPAPTIAPVGAYVPAAPPASAMPVPAAPTPPAPVGVPPGAPLGAPPTGASSGWQPAPEPTQSARVQLAPPEPLDAVTQEPPTNPSRPGAPDLAAKPEPKGATPLPVGIPQFDQPADRAASGLRPSLDDGLEWLRDRGYRTVVHVHAPAEADAADRKQVERYGMAYVSFELTERQVTREKLDEFVRLVRDAQRQPIFVYDRDGRLAGPLWYAYFRLAENLSDDQARLRARRHGLRDENADPLWLATQKLLNQ